MSTTHTNHPELRRLIRTVPDFPKPGIPFLDINPLLADRHAYGTALTLMIKRLKGQKIDIVAGLDARGFILGAALAERLNVGFIPLRKSAKLPPPKRERSYVTEYSTDTIALGEGLIKKSQIVLVVDDVLATGGTLEAACALIKECDGIPIALVLIEIEALGGRAKLGTQRVERLLLY
jgi:adenine phosphoribosyltransferase